jgi:hypothetical protein
LDRAGFSPAFLVASLCLWGGILRWDALFPLSVFEQSRKVCCNKNPETRQYFMFKTSLVAAALVASLLSGCVSPNSGYGNSPTNSAAVRTIGGAAAGAIIADATGGSKTTGALLGAVAGGVSCGIPGLPACY